MRTSALQPFVFLLSFMLLSAAGGAAGDDPQAVAQGARVRDRFFEASGGLERIRAIHDLSFDAVHETYGDRLSSQLLRDGRSRMQANDRIAVFDGKTCWLSFHGVVQEMAADECSQTADLDLRRMFFHGLLDEDWRPVDVEYLGQEQRRGRTFDMIGYTTGASERNTLYLDAATGLVDKRIVQAPDADLRELKNLYTFEAYAAIDGLMLPTRLHGVCLTRGDEILLLTVLSNIALNAGLAGDRFQRPERTAPPVTLEDNRLAGQVVALSGGGSLITNFTAEDLAVLNIADGAVLDADVRGHRPRMPLFIDLQTAGGIERGDYLATFNGTPALWLVKAYVGMTSDDSTYAVGDTVRLSLAPEQE